MFDLHEEIDEITALGYRDIARLQELRRKQKLSEAEKQELQELVAGYGEQ